MEIAMDEFGAARDDATGGIGGGHQGVALGVSTGVVGHNRHSSVSPLSQHEEDLSDPDRQDDESGEELPQQPLQSNSHSASVDSQTPIVHSPHTHFMDTSHSYLAKVKLEPPSGDSNLNMTKNNLEAFQAAMVNSGFPLPFSLNPSSYLGSGHQFPQLPLLSQTAAALNAANNNNSSLQRESSNLSRGDNGNTGGVNNNVQPMSSASSHSSESSIGSHKDSKSGILNTSGGPGGIGSTGGASAHAQQTSWSFEEQFKQVRQLYELSNDPKRKEFLDDLFSFMQKKGSPINRLPIMAKSVLDLFELYNLVITRGGLVEVINKKMWQEIIKGLHLPSSITSAAFTLRTQYMKYLYPYECDKLHLSSPEELQQAIDGNRREGRRSNYGSPYSGNGSNAASAAEMMHHAASQRGGPHGSLPGLQHLPLSLVNAVAAANAGQHQVNPQSLHNGSAVHTPLTHHPHHPQHGSGLGQPPPAGLTPEVMNEYLQMLMTRQAAERSMGVDNSSLLNPRAESVSPAPQDSRTPPHTHHDILQRFSLWNMYNNNMSQPRYPIAPTSPEVSSHSPPPASPEPQREALDLGLKTSSDSSTPDRHSPTPLTVSSFAVKRDIDQVETQSMSNKRANTRSDSPQQENHTPKRTHIVMSNRGGDNSMVISMEVNGVTYEGVLFARGKGNQTRNQKNGSTSNGSNNERDTTSGDAS